jgi:hypothetical protein
MQRYFGALTIVLLLGMGGGRILLMRKAGIKPRSSAKSTKRTS